MSFKKIKFGIDFGELNQRIDIYNQSISRDAIGGEIVSLALWRQCWAKVEPQALLHEYQNRAKRERQKYIFHLRYQDGIIPQMVIVHDEDNYEIQSVVNIETADQWLKIIATRKI